MTLMTQRVASAGISNTAWVIDWPGATVASAFRWRCSRVARRRSAPHVTVVKRPLGAARQKKTEERGEKRGSWLSTCSSYLSSENRDLFGQPRLDHTSLQRTFGDGSPEGTVFGTSGTRDSSVSASINAIRSSFSSALRSNLRILSSTLSSL